MGLAQLGRLWGDKGGGRHWLLALRGVHSCLPLTVIKPVVLKFYRLMSVAFVGCPDVR